ncbi:MAG: protein-glutamate O-methyltransferase CheR [Chloroflexota bacterium]|nr:MAG: protein-glutamate O-methyltransferase CheR [Chloroflexota bacterium]
MLGTDRGLKLNDHGLSLIRQMIYDQYGIFVPDNKGYLLANRVSARMDKLGVAEVSTYHAMLKSGGAVSVEMNLLINDLTINETCFFRNPAQIAVLQDTVIPRIVETKAKIGFTRLKVWSAGCSSGEEPYTLAMVLLEKQLSLLKGWQVEIAGTDISDDALAGAATATYDQYAMRNVADYFKKKYFAPVRETEGVRYRVKDDVKALVRFSKLNLANDIKMTFMKGMDVISCCNVLIYFDSNSKKKVIQHFYNNLNRGGYLFLGHAESLTGVDDRFKLVHFPGGIAYCKE